ncbi:hypothetical protein GYA19_01890 [Candidatus Beckwithbacteria bacterium]|nr:hypothetical protein [Candidatus Beckwithbacteria bacterium]
MLYGMFNLRTTLIEQGRTREEILFLESVIADWLYVLSDKGSGIGDLAGRLYFLGRIPDRGEALRLLAPKLTEVDRKEKGWQRSFPVIGVVGRIASGKGAIGEIIAKYYDSFHYPFSDRLREVAIAQGNFPPWERSELRDVDRAIKPTYGPETFVKWTLAMIERRALALHMPQIASVDGFRSVEETQWFLSQPHTVLIAVTAADKVRFQRTLGRRREGEDPLTFEGFMGNDKIERQWIDPILKLANFTLDNSGSLEELEEKVLRIIRRLI